MRKDILVDEKKYTGLKCSVGGRLWMIKKEIGLKYLSKVNTIIYLHPERKIGSSSLDNGRSFLMIGEGHLLKMFEE